MRLSTTQKLLIPFFLINFLTLFLKADANAQSLLASNFSFNNYLHSRTLLDESENDSNYPETDAPQQDIRPVAAHVTLPVNYYHIPENSYSNLLPYHTAKSNFKVYKRYRPILGRVYSTNLMNSVRVTFKLFKVVIIPLWQSK